MEGREMGRTRFCNPRVNFMINPNLQQDLVDLINGEDKFWNFAEISRLVPGFAGEISYGARDLNPNRVIWPKLSQEAIDIVNDINGSLIFMWPASIDQYAEEDQLDLPLDDSDQIDRSVDAFWLISCFYREPY